MKKNPSVYNCSQENFYVVATNGLNSCLNHNAAFAAYKPSYTNTYIQQQLDSIVEAENMKTLDDLNLAVKKARRLLEKSITVSRRNFMKLKGYINAISTEETKEINLAEAGSHLYGRSAKIWPSMNTLLIKSNEYIVANKTALLANNNMPVSFATTYKNDSDDCNLYYKKLYELQNIKSVSVLEKVEANNAIYEKLMAMFTDGQCIFSDNEKVKKEFVFRQVLKAVKGAGIAGLKGTIRTIETDTPVAAVTVTSADGKYSAITDNKGRYHIRQILAGTYSFSIEKPGYQPYDQTITIEPGTTRRGNFAIALQENQLKVA